ncbi:uroporphyrinogen III methyltransferase/synthase [Pseudomonas sp. SJZ085]|nr:uroporphyrinogen III methyltransferase/synthase [Pseudomonas sp. SJZ074]TWC30789.1 uroporphyrinogen III methyltransferase/synthase [Pseudomonas sp. SJZ085]TWC54781.1 uroporphyrinogen III methyltransferase/synthase [Pseudomonas sp. SJZ124]
MGWRLLLTRPEDESSALATVLAEAGVFSSSLPLLAIEPIPLSDSGRALLQRLDRYCAVIVVSKPAARLCLEHLREYWPEPPEQPWFSVGAATGQILTDAGLSVFYPAEGDDSEALLQLPALRQALTRPDPQVLIVRGEGGRGLLAERLREQGASVDYLELYQRGLPEYREGELLAKVEAERLNALMVSSGQSFEHLHRLAGAAWPDLARLPLFVPSPRVAGMARAAGVRSVIDCRGASAAALLAALRGQSVPFSNAKDGYVSETALPKDQDRPVIDTPVETPVPVAPRRGNGLAIVALLLGVAGVAVGGWGVWQVRHLQANNQQQSAQVQALNDQAQNLKLNEQRLSERLAQMPAAEELEERRRQVAQLQGDQQHLSQRLETVLGASRKDWRLAEAEHLLRLASLRLSALQDISSAQALVQGADEILREQNDPGSFAAREQLAKTLAALRSTEQPDRTGLFLQLGALREQVLQLTELAPEYKDRGESLLGLTADGDGASRWAQWWDQISRYIRIDFNADENVRPLLAGQSLMQVRLALSLALEQAQWAALNGQAPVYTQALDEARDVLKNNFNQDNPQSKVMLERVAELAKQPVTVVTPDLTATLSSVQAYLERRNLNAEESVKPLAKPAEQGATP